MPRKLRLLFQTVPIVAMRMTLLLWPFFISGVVDPLTDASYIQKVTAKADDKDDLLDSYNALLLEHIKFERQKKRALESLKENERKICALKKYMEEKKSFNDCK